MNNPAMPAADTPPAGSDQATATAVVVGEREVSYARFEQHIQRVLQWLQVRQPGLQGQVVGVCVSHPYGHWLANLALMRLGAVGVSLNAGQLQLPLAVDALVCDQPLQAPWPLLQIDGALWDTGSEPVAPDLAPGPAARSGNAPHWHWGLHPQARRWVLTSGTTGKPKVVAIDSADMALRMSAGLENFSHTITPQAQTLSLLGTETFGGLMLPLLTWLRGGTVLLGEPAGTAQGRMHLPYFRSTFLMASPAHLNALLQGGGAVWPGRDRRQVHVGGARLPARVRDDALRQIGHEVHSHYGATEVGLVATCDARLLDNNPGLAGKVLANVQVQVVDEQGSPLPPGQQGLVRCRKPGMARGYQGEAQSPQFQGGWFYPGDLGTLSADGWLSVTGREDDVINLGGLKLSAVELETRWLQLPGVKDIGVVAQGGGLQQRLVAVAVLEVGCDPDTLGRHIASTLPYGARFIVVRQNMLPRNAMGKLDRNLLGQRMGQALR